MLMCSGHLYLGLSIICHAREGKSPGSHSQKEPRLRADFAPSPAPVARDREVCSLRC